MKGWILNLSTRRDGIDDIDELFQSIDRSRLVIGTEFQNWAKLKFSGDYRISSNKVILPMRLLCWRHGAMMKRINITVLFHQRV
jgi:hypothetical protein